MTAGVIPQKHNINELLPNRYNNIAPNSLTRIPWGGPAHLFALSIATNRPIHVFGYLDDDIAKRYVWSPEAEERPQITINFHNSHFVCLLQKTAFNPEIEGRFAQGLNYLIPEHEISRPTNSELYNRMIELFQPGEEILLDEDL